MSEVLCTRGRKASGVVHSPSENDNGYADTARRMVELARKQPGFLGLESVRDGLGITVSYWESLDAIRAWKENAEHRLAQDRGRDWYLAYRVRVCRVEKEYGC